MAHEVEPYGQVSLVAPLKRSDSGSRAFLGLADDQREYWIKGSNNPQGPRSLIAEMVAHSVARLLDAPVPETALVSVPEGIKWYLEPGLPLHHGLAHGSLNISDVIEHDEWGQFSSRDDNRRRSASLVALWDLCLGVDPQWLYQAHADFSVWSFDHGMWLAGEADWTLGSLRRIGTSPWLYDIDPGVASREGLRDAADRMEALTLQHLQAIVEQVPLEWETSEDELSELASILYVRTEGVAQRLRSAAQHTRHP